MPSATPDTSRTARLLELMKKGDDAFNARDFAAVDTVHHPDMVAHITGNPEPIYGRETHSKAMAQLVRIFPTFTCILIPIRFSSEAATGSPWLPT